MTGSSVKHNSQSAEFVFQSHTKSFVNHIRGKQVTTYFIIRYYQKNCSQYFVKLESKYNLPQKVCVWGEILFM